MDRDGTNQVENDNGMPTCEVVDSTVSTVPTLITGTVATDCDDAGTADIDESLARINASDGDRLTVRAGTHIQEIYVDGEAPTFSEVSPGDGDRFKSAELRIQFEVRDGGAGLRHDGENVTSIDLDAVEHDAANATNTEPDVFGDNDGITDREPISEQGGGSADIDVVFYLPPQVTAKADAEKARAAADKAQAAAKADATKATDAATAARAAAARARTVLEDYDANDPEGLAARQLDNGAVGTAAGALDTAATALWNDNDTADVVTDDRGAAAALTVAATALTAVANGTATERLKRPTRPVLQRLRPLLQRERPLLQVVRPILQRLGLMTLIVCQRKLYRTTGLLLTR